jgi:hypothetical protein
MIYHILATKKQCYTQPLRSKKRFSSIVLSFVFFPFSAQYPSSLGLHPPNKLTPTSLHPTMASNGKD